MTEGHINNILKMYKNNYQYDCYHGKMVKEWVIIFKTELAFRKSATLLEKSFQAYLKAKHDFTTKF